MQVAQAIQFHELSKVAAVVYAVRFTKSGDLVSLQVSADAPELTKAQSFGLFVPTEAEQLALDAVAPLFAAPAPKTDPMADRLRKSEVEKPVAYVLRYVAARTDLGRKDLIANLVANGIATYTARTQVQVGLKRRAELAARLAAVTAAAEAKAKAEAEEAAREAFEQAKAEQEEGEPAAE